MKKNRLLLILLALVAFGPTAWAWSGSGTSGDPYLIASTGDWNTLATNVNAGTSYSGKYFKLTENITISTMVGTNDHRFSGTFNGNGHTLTLNLNASENICAPFRYIYGATIKSLIVNGTITGNSNKQLAGIAGMAYGTNHISNCWVNVTMTSSFSGDSSIAGLMVQIASGTTHITNCLFTGSFNCPNANKLGGFVGWTSNSATGNYTNCLFKPSSVTIANTDGCSTFARLASSGNANFTKAYYGNSLFVTNQGTNGTSMTNNDFLAAFGEAWEIKNSALIPVMSVRPLTGEGTVQSPYLIASATDWNNLAFNVNIVGETYNGNYFKMTADIEVSEMVGTDGNKFGGIFNGDGHKLTFNKGTSSNHFNEDYCAPFRFINDANIKRLHIDGTIYTAKQKAAAIGLSNGTNNIQLCRSSLIINSSKSGDGTHAGFISVLDGGSTYFTDCLFDGTFEGPSTHSWGGFCGWARGQAYITNCLFAPASVNIDASSSATFSRNPDNVHCTNSYYKQTINTVQGTDASGMSNDELVAALGVGWTISENKVIPAFQAYTFTGNGTSGNPFLIETTLDWNKLSHNVNACDMTHSGQYFKLTGNIIISATIGSESFPFGGIFDGDGHVLHLNCTDVGTQGTAPFRYIKDATIQYIKTDGLLVGGNHCSGLVGFAKGTNTIQGCEVAAEVYGSKNSTHCGGILGHGLSSNTTIQDCLFSGVLDGATTSTGIIFGWGDAGNHTIINCLSSGNCAGGTVLLITGNGTKTITNCYHSTDGPSDGTDASGMSRDALQTALGAGWGTRGSHVVPVRFAEEITPQEDAAMVDLDSDYVPTQIINGNFGVRPWMSFRYNGTDYMSYSSSDVGNNNVIEASYPNGVNGGWNTTETTIFDKGLFEYMHSVYNDNIPNYGGCVEMNAENSAVLWQDLTTHANDVIRWSLLHAVRTNYGPDVQSMRVEVGAPEYDGENIVAATGVNTEVDSKITTATKATYNSDGYSGTYAQGADNLVKLALSKTATEDNSAWHQVRGIYLIPEGQTVTRFAFISTSTTQISAGNYLDNLAFSTLIGNLSAVQLDNGDVMVKGYWGETDASKQLVVATNASNKSALETGTTLNYDMSSVANENFKIIIPAASLGASSSLSVYHEDYPDAQRTIPISYYKVITKYTSERNGWHFISSPIGTVNPENVANMTVNNFDIYRFNQSPAPTLVDGVNKYLEWENWKKPNEDEFNYYHFDLEPGRGYLYANSEDVTLVFSGTPYSGDSVVTLDYSEGNPASNMHGWNLVGNPFPVAAYVDRPFYKMNDEGTGIEPVDNFDTYSPIAIPSCTGIMVQTSADEVANETNKVTFSTSAPSQNANNNGNLQIAVAHANSTRSNAVMDKAIVSFNEGSRLGKFYFDEQNANIYLPQGAEEYAIAFSDRQGEMPLNFKVKENGEYTISVTPEGVEMNYLHLIDNMTGADIDLLAPEALIAGEDPQIEDSTMLASQSPVPSYTFTATTIDYESRFKLVFVANENDNENENGTFAFFSNGGWIIVNEGEATLQVIDVTGRILSSESINGCVSKSINAPAGVYMIRLINGNDVKVQKVVVR